MSRKERTRAQPDRLAALLASGAHGAAARAARAVLAQPDAPEEERARAGTALRSLAPDPFAAVAGLAGVGVAIAIGIWLVAGAVR
jgi:hypothetical protein